MSHGNPARTVWSLLVVNGEMNWDNPLDESTKTEASCHSRCEMIKSSRGQNKEQWPYFCTPSPTIMTSQYERNILERNVKQQRKKNKQTKTYKQRPTKLPVLNMRRKIILWMMGFCFYSIIYGFLFYSYPNVKLPVKCYKMLPKSRCYCLEQEGRFLFTHLLWLENKYM